MTDDPLPVCIVGIGKEVEGGFGWEEAVLWGDAVVGECWNWGKHRRSSIDNVLVALE